MSRTDYRLLSGRPALLVIALSMAGFAVGAVLYGLPDIIWGEGPPVPMKKSWQEL